jgi:hypothetical protein
LHNAGVQVLPIDASLVEALLREDAFPHPAGDIELMETHISWVILAGNYAYKIKKPVVLDFLDFGTLEKRRHFCEEELRLNRPWAPELYLDVVAIAGPASEPVMGGDGEALEYAVKMLRFDQDLRLDRQLDDGLLTVSDMKELGQKIAARATPTRSARTRPNVSASPGRRFTISGRTSTIWATSSKKTSWRSCATGRHANSKNTQPRCGSVSTTGSCATAMVTCISAISCACRRA